MCLRSIPCRTKTAMSLSAHLCTERRFTYVDDLGMSVGEAELEHGPRVARPLFALVDLVLDLLADESSNLGHPGAGLLPVSQCALEIERGGANLREPNIARHPR